MKNLICFLYDLYFFVILCMTFRSNFQTQSGQITVTGERNVVTDILQCLQQQSNAKMPPLKAVTKSKVELSCMKKRKNLSLVTNL